MGMTRRALVAVIVGVVVAVGATSAAVFVMVGIADRYGEAAERHERAAALLLEADLVQVPATASEDAERVRRAAPAGGDRDELLIELRAAAMAAGVVVIDSAGSQAAVDLEADVGARLDGSGLSPFAASVTVSGSLADVADFMERISTLQRWIGVSPVTVTFVDGAVTADIAAVSLSSVSTEGP
jgi:hypothetical protein